jgi:hypothetical protein
MTDLTGFILEEIAGSSSSETSNIVQVVAVTAAWQKDMMETLLRYHQLQAKLLAAAIAIGAIRNQSVPRRIAYTQGHFDHFAHDDEWCVEFLRFTRRQIVEMAMLLDIPSCGAVAVGVATRNPNPCRDLKQAPALQNPPRAAVLTYAASPLDLSKHAHCKTSLLVRHP